MTKNLQCPVCRYFPPGSESSGVNSKDVLMFVDWLTKEWIEFYLDLFERLKTCGHRARIVDLSAFTFPRSWSSFTRSIHLDKGPDVGVIQRLKPKFSGRIPNNEFDNQLEESVRSHSATRFNGKTNLVSEAIDAYILKMTSRSLYSQLPQLDSSQSVWIFQNGRLPHQRAVLEFCKLKHLDYLIMESNLHWTSHYWARPYPPHDRDSLQEETKTRISQVDTAQRKLANIWFSEHGSPNSKINEFTKSFDAPRKKTVIQEPNLVSKNAVIFTSSSDEFIGLGEYWPWTGWNSQYESFLHISKILRSLGYSITLRIHPNLQNKSLRAMRADYLHLTRLAHECPVTIIGPQSAINSYDLLDAAEIVVVSGSTIGLEAIHKGKKVIVTEHSNYDLLPGVLKINPETPKESIIEFLSEPLVLETPSAKDWAAVQMSLGWAARERPGILRNISIWREIEYRLNWTTILSELSLLIPRLLETMPKEAILRKINNLGDAKSGRSD